MVLKNTKVRTIHADEKSVFLQYLLYHHLPKIMAEVIFDKID